MIMQSGRVAEGAEEQGYYCKLLHPGAESAGKGSRIRSLSEKDKEAYKASIFQTVFYESGVVLISYV